MSMTTRRDLLCRVLAGVAIGACNNPRGNVATTKGGESVVEKFISWLLRFDKEVGLVCATSINHHACELVFRSLTESSWDGCEFVFTPALLAGGDDTITIAAWDFYCQYYIKCGSTLPARQVLLLLPSGLRVVCSLIFAYSEISNGGFETLFDVSDDNLNVVIAASLRAVGATAHIDMFDRGFRLHASGRPRDSLISEYRAAANVLYDYEAESKESLGKYLASFIRKHIHSCEFSQASFTNYLNGMQEE